MSQFDASSLLKDVVTGLVTLSESMKIIGEPVEAGGKVVIPAVVARVGFGAGGGAGSTGGSEEEEQAEQGAGGGGAGGAMMTPVFLVVDEEGERLLTVPGGLSAAGSLLEKAKEALDRVAQRRQGVAEELEEDEELQDLGESEGA